MSLPFFSFSFSFSSAFSFLLLPSPAFSFLLLPSPFPSRLLLPPSSFSCLPHKLPNRISPSFCGLKTPVSHCSGLGVRGGSCVWDRESSHELGDPQETFQLWASSPERAITVNQMLVTEMLYFGHQIHNFKEKLNFPTKAKGKKKEKKKRIFISRFKNF